MSVFVEPFNATLASGHGPRFLLQARDPLVTFWPLIGQFFGEPAQWVSEVQYVDGLLHETDYTSNFDEGQGGVERHSTRQVDQCSTILA